MSAPHIANSDPAKISIQFLKGIGPAKQKLFANLGVATVEDLLYLFPRRYEDRRNFTALRDVKIGEEQTIAGQVIAQGGRQSWRTKKKISEIVLDDGTGRIFCVWFNQPYIESYFKPGAWAVCYGRPQIYQNKIQMVAPEYEIFDPRDEDSLSLKRIVPVYPLTAGFSQRFVRKMVHGCLDSYCDQIKDELPVSLRNRYRLANIRRSLKAIHFPATFAEQAEGLRRVAFEEFYFFQISALLRRQSVKRQAGHVQRMSDEQILRYINAFPFAFTEAQLRAAREIRQDLASVEPMMRLLQGDVGCGKTVVAFLGCWAAFLNQQQSAVMAPTEILARQHYDNLCQWTAAGGLPGLRPRLWVSGMKNSERDAVRRAAIAGEADVVVGTHALLTEDLRFKNLSYVVIDEQHKFGVGQRSRLVEKAKLPDVLIMTATPIPRTLGLTLYADLDVSVIDALPAGRGKVRTHLFAQSEIERVYQIVRDKVAAGRQIYFVYPVITESQNADLKAAQERYTHFLNKEFKNFRLGLIHGRLSQNEAQAQMAAFKSGKIQILVATTVLEVGIDVPNANVMVIEHADRFGLAQLHQLRGRVGRGKEDALCLLVADPGTAEGQERLQVFLSTTDGFKIAEKDLEIRGPGHFFGRHQHGLNELKVANPLAQIDILQLARKEAAQLVAEDPGLTKSENSVLLNVIRRRYPNYLDMVQAG
ncbi:MAG: ATP-dependent DNA helicase RecG [Candidatus Omnitrophica bacterium]|nr:ATP-dependent DNA helicase RecG [Candidatus Omnitrophota bacterium]